MLEDPRMSGNFYLLVVQEVISFGAETWVVNPHIRSLLEIFHYIVVIRLVGMNT